MATSGWIRDWKADLNAYFAGRAAADALGKDSTQQRYAGRTAQREFRQGFQEDLTDQEGGGAVQAQLPWGQPVTILVDAIPTSLDEHSQIEVDIGGQAIQGWVRNAALARPGYVARPSQMNTAISHPKKLDVALRDAASGSADTLLTLLWGDPVQILQRSGNWLQVAARGWLGWLNENDVGDEALLEVYFIDVGQGDGVLVCDPDRRHLLIDGGLPRSHQQSGKNAADFVDWKFFVDYGQIDINLDAVIASHCDKDHYGGLDDLVSDSERAKEERDTLSVNVDKVFHPGISYWDIDAAEKAAHAEAPNDSKWLGPETPWPAEGDGTNPHGSFRGSDEPNGHILTRLFDGRISVADALDDTHHPHLAGDWQKFIERIDAAGAQSIERVGLSFDEVTTPAYLDGWGANSTLSIRVLGPLTLEGPDGPALPDFGSESQNTNGHSVLLRLDYDKARILLTGDLNKNSMHYLLRGYENHEDELACDVAKACHHGSHDISYRFLEKVKAGATVISSGDSEGFGHPRPEVVGASAITGFKSVDEDADTLRTPLVYSTEVERGVSLGEVKHLTFSNFHISGQPQQGTLFAKKPTSNSLTAGYNAQVQNNTLTDFLYTYFKGVWTKKTGTKNLAKVRILDKVNYGLVSVRTDGKLIMCATQRDAAGAGWTIHAFPARFS